MKDTKAITFEILAFAMDEKNHSVFVEYSPHVEQIVVRLFLNGWSHENQDPQQTYRVNLKDDEATAMLRRIRDELVSLINGEAFDPGL